MAGYIMDDGHVFHSGIPNTDVDLGYDGKIYLSDFGGGWRRTDKGNIYTLFDPKRVKSAAVQQTEKLFHEGFPTKISEGLFDSSPTPTCGCAHAPSS